MGKFYKCPRDPSYYTRRTSQPTVCTQNLRYCPARQSRSLLSVTTLIMLFLLFCLPKKVSKKGQPQQNSLLRQSSLIKLL